MNTDKYLRQSTSSCRGLDPDTGEPLPIDNFVTLTNANKFQPGELDIPNPTDPPRLGKVFGTAGHQTKK